MFGKEKKSVEVGKIDTKTLKKLFSELIERIDCIIDIADKQYVDFYYFAIYAMQDATNHLKLEIEFYNGPRCSKSEYSYDADFDSDKINIACYLDTKTKRFYNVEEDVDTAVGELVEGASTYYKGLRLEDVNNVLCGSIGDESITSIINRIIKYLTAGTKKPIRYISLVCNGKDMNTSFEQGRSGTGVIYDKNGDAVDYDPGEGDSCYAYYKGKDLFDIPITEVGEGAILLRYLKETDDYGIEVHYEPKGADEK